MMRSLFCFRMFPIPPPDPTTECYVGDHGTFLPLALLMVLLYSVGIPMAVLLFVVKTEDLFDDLVFSKFGGKKKEKIKKTWGGGAGTLHFISNRMWCWRRAWALFVLLLLTLMCCQPTELNWAFFVS